MGAGTRRLPIRLPARWSTGAGAALVAIAGLAAYANSFSGSFVFDDRSVILDNTAIRQLWPPWHILFQTDAGGLTTAGRPLVGLSLAVNYAISGTGTWSYHAFNLAIHVLAGLALFGVVRRTLENAEARGLPAPGFRPSAVPVRGIPSCPAIPTAAAVALIWTVHPLQTESVTYVVQRAESLMGLLYLLTLYCFIRSIPGSAPGEARARPGVIWPVLSVLACLLGMAAKEVMVSAPLIVLLYDRTFAAGSFREALRRRRWTYAGLAATWILLGCCVASTSGVRGGTAGLGVVSWWRYALTQATAIVHYLRLCFWPHRLVLDYGDELVTQAARVVPCLAVVALLVAGTAVALVKRPAAGFLGAWFFAILAPSSSVVPVGAQTVAEHRMYLPLAAIVAFVVCGILRLAGRRGILPGRLSGLLLAAVAVLGVLTHNRNEDYRSDLSIWRDAVAGRPGNARAHANLACALDLADRPAEAIAECERALEINPHLVAALKNLGDILRKQGRAREAIPRYEQAVRLEPASAETLDSLGIVLGQAGRLPEAILRFQEALRLKPGFPEAHNNLGIALAQTGRLPEAIHEFEEALRLQPGLADARSNLSLALHDAGRASNGGAPSGSGPRQP